MVEPWKEPAAIINAIPRPVMPYTIPVSFAVFLDRISPSATANETALVRSNAVVNLLRRSFHIVEVVPMGSLHRGTALRDKSDADVLVALHYGHHVQNQSPLAVLQAVRDCLSQYNARIVKKNGQAVTLYFETWPSVDVVPASQVVDGLCFCHFNIPDSTKNRWIPSEPRVHDVAMANLPASQRHLVQVVKHWNLVHSEYLHSFHIEAMTLTMDFIGTDWTWEVFRFFDQALLLIDRPLVHPHQTNVWVDEYLADVDRLEAKRRLETARNQARTAWYAVYPPNNDHRRAITIYESMFGARFPPYG